jgi:beta-lactamase regulating signal transducer with metallopeptidase domain
MFYAMWLVALCRLMIPAAIPSPTSVFNVLRLPGSNISAGYTAAAEQPLFAFAGLPEVPAAGTEHNFEHIDNGVQTGIVYRISDLLTPERSLWSAIIMEPVILAWLVGLILSGGLFTVMYIKHINDFTNSVSVRGGFIENWHEAHKLKRKIKIRASSNITTPLTYGILRPVILLPKSIFRKAVNADPDNRDNGDSRDNRDELEYILAHEFVHIRRFDALTKLVAAAALCIHWFNPLVWVMYFLFNRDMEISCDETVVNMFGHRSKKGLCVDFGRRGRA